MATMQPERVFAHIRAGNLALANYESDLGLQTSLPGTDEHWRFRFAKAECLRLRGQTGDALELTGTRIDAEHISPEIFALWKMHRGYVLGVRNSYLEAKQALNEAERVAKENQLQSVLVEILVRRGMILFFAEDLSGSQETYREALQLAQQQGDLFLKAVALAGTGKNLMIRGNFHHAIDWYERALAAAQEDGACSAPS